MKRAISVIIPHRNRPELLAQALDSVFRQTLPPAEVVIVDDCSRPEVREQVRKLGRSCQLIESDRSLGPCLTRNIGVEKAKSEWVAFLDDDDLYVREKLERQNQFLNDHPDCDLLVGPMLMVRPNGSAEHWGYRQTRQLRVADGLVYTAGCMQTLLMRRADYLALGGLDPAFRNMEDLEFGIRSLASGKRVFYLAEALVIYRLGGRDQQVAHWGRMTSCHLKAVYRHRKLYRREFGPFADLSMQARLWKRYGLQRGRILGRSMWALGCLVAAATGDRFTAWDSVDNSVGPVDAAALEDPMMTLARPNPIP